MVMQKSTKEQQLWSKDHTSYISTRIIPGYGTLVYMAATDKPELGWQNGAFTDYKF